MKYYKTLEGWIDGIEPETFFEVDEEGNYTRVLYILLEKRVGSNFPHYTNPHDGHSYLTMPESPPTQPPEYSYTEEDLQKHANELGISTEDLISRIKKEEEELNALFEEYSDDENEISKEEFESEWAIYLDEWKDYWKKVQSKYEVGQICQAEVWLFYPLCAIIKLDKEDIGIIPTQDYLKTQSKNKQNFYSRDKLEVKVIGFDNLNMWVELEFYRAL